MLIPDHESEPRVAVTPHIGASTQEAQPRIARRVAQTVLRFSRYGSVRDMVFSPKVKLGLVEDGAEGRVLLCVAHSTARGTKRAVDDAIYKAGAHNINSLRLLALPLWRDEGNSSGGRRTT